MAKAKKHEMTKEELRAPDEVQAALSGFWDKLYQHRKLVVAGVVGLLALGIVLWVVGSMKRASIESRSLALHEAAKAIGGTVGPEPTLDPSVAALPRPPRFADEAARVTAVTEGLNKFVAEHGGDDVAELASIAIINAKLNKGDAAGAVTDIDAWLAAHGGSIVKPVALDLKARAQVAAGQRDAGLATYEELAKLVGPGQLRALAYKEIGDLQNPGLGGTGDAAKAKAAYDAALAALPPDTSEAGRVMIMGKPGLRGQIENHLGLLP